MVGSQPLIQPLRSPRAEGLSGRASEGLRERAAEGLRGQDGGAEGPRGREVKVESAEAREELGARVYRPSIAQSHGITTWEAVLNEILELRNSGLLETTGIAYQVLQDVEHEVLPSWQDHGKHLLSDSGLDVQSLRSRGLHTQGIEKLLQSLYAFSFGFGTVVKKTISMCRPDARGELLQRIADVFSTLVAEALDHGHRDLLAKIFSENAAELGELRRNKVFLEKRVESVEVEIQRALAQAAEAIAAREKAEREALQSVEKAHREAAEARAERDQTVKEAAEALEIAQQAKAETEEWKVKIPPLEAEITKLKSLLDDERAERKKDQESSKDAVEDKTKKIKQLTAEVKAERRKLESSETQLKATMTRVKAEEAAKTKALEEIEKLKIQYAELEKESSAKQAKLRAELLSQQSAQAIMERQKNEEIAGLHQEIKLLKKDIENLEAKEKKALDNIGQLEQKNSKLNGELDLVCANQAVLRNSYRESENEREEGLEGLKKLTAEIELLTTTKEHLQQEVQDRDAAIVEAAENKAKLEKELLREQNAHKETESRLSDEVVKEVLDREVLNLAWSMKDHDKIAKLEKSVQSLMQRRKAIRTVRLFNKMRSPYYRTDKDFLGAVKSEISKLKGATPGVLQVMTDAYVETDDNPRAPPDVTRSDALKPYFELNRDVPH